MVAFRENLRTLNSPWRWTLGTLGVLVVLLIAAQLVANIFLADIVGSYLKENVRKSTNNVYRLDYDDLDFGVLGGSTELKNIRLKPDSASYAQQNDDRKRFPVIGEADIKALEIDGVSLWAYLFRNTLSVGSVLVDSLVIRVDNIRDIKRKRSRTFSSVDSSLYALISNQFSALQLGAFEIRDSSFRLKKQSSDEDYASLDKLNLRLKDMRIDSASARSGRLFVTDDIELDGTGYAMNPPPGFYAINLKKFELSSSDQRLRTDSLQLIPRLPRYDFSAKKGMQTDRIDLLIGNIILREVDFSRAVESGRFYAGSLDIDSTKLDVFHDMNQPFPPERSPELPQLAFKHLPYPIKIDTMKVSNTDVRYTEHREGAPKPGTVTFENLRASIIGLSNYREDLESGRTATMEARTSVMGEGLLNTWFTFYLHDSSGCHTIKGNLGKIEFSEFNPALENLAFVHISQGVINSMEFSMELDKEVSKGSVILNYKNLNIELLQSETLEQGTGQQIKSFIANTFVVKTDNNDPPLRKGEIKFERDRQKSVFNFWWKSLATGLENSIGL